MADEQVRLLDARRVVGGGDQAGIHQAPEAPAPAAAKAGGLGPQGARLFQRPQDIGAVAGGADADDQIPRPAQGLDLAGEDLVEAIIIANGRQGGAVRGQGDRGQAGPVALEPPDEFRGQVLAIRRAPPIAEPEDPAPAGQAVDHEGGDALDVRPLFPQPFDGAQMVIKVPVDHVTWNSCGPGRPGGRGRSSSRARPGSR